MNLAELGEIAKAYEDARPDDSHAGRKVAGTGLGIWGAGQAAGMSGLHAAHVNQERGINHPKFKPGKGLKRMIGGSAGAALGTGTILAGGGIGAHNMYRKTQKLKHERAMELAREQRGQQS